MSLESSGSLIYHLALRAEWRAATDAGIPYRRSTLGRSLDDVGFIHCSFQHQVQDIADLVYRRRRDVILLTIDPNRVRADVRVENLEGGQQSFPHIYGELPLAAVVRSNEVPVDDAGRLQVGMVLGQN